ncbi:MAG: metallophosphoesterase family protein [Bacteroidia bacterium]
MNLFVIGDIHGCFKTFKTLLDQWDKSSELLIQLGDLIDRGNSSPQTVKLARELQSKYSNTVFLKGNHEILAIQNYNNTKSKWYDMYGKKVMWQYQLEERDFEKDVQWFGTLPLYWENEHVFISHAGVSNSENWKDENDPKGILWNRTPLKNIGKLQVIGHTPQKKGPVYDPLSNHWNIDSGAYLGKKLSGIKLKPGGELIEVISVPTLRADLE